MDTQYARWFTRLAAATIDAMIAIGVYFLYNMATGVSLTDPSALESSGSNIPVLLISIAMIIMTGLKGQTPGKMLFKIKVVKTSGENISMLTAILRETVGKWISSILFIGYLWPLWDSKKQGWHDKIAGTIVVKV